MPLDDYFAANRANWDDRVAIHKRSKSYDVDGFVAGRLALRQFEVDELGSVVGKSLVHLQCHFGMDTLSWARLGATVTGLDFSEQAVEAARELAAMVGSHDARFVQANVYDAPVALGGEQFDIVYTGVGAICWLPAIRPWAMVVAACLKPGGTFYIRECHPVLWSLDVEAAPGTYLMRYPYFETEQPLSWDDAVTYTDNPEELAITNTRTYEWNHGLGEIISALIDAGLVIDFLHEQQTVDWPALPWLEPTEDHQWKLPETDHDRVPLMFSLKAHKPA